MKIEMQPKSLTESSEEMHNSVDYEGRSERFGTILTI